MKLELGCGSLQTEGFIHLDVRELDGVDVVRDAADLTCWADNTFSVIKARDLIDHFSWRDVPKVLREWLRVLQPGGYLELEQDNANHLVELIANPGSRGLWRLENETDWERFSRIAYGHQDYPENTHRTYFTPPWLTGLLYEAGAATVETMDANVFRFRLRATL